MVTKLGTRAGSDTHLIFPVEEKSNTFASSIARFLASILITKARLAGVKHTRLFSAGFTLHEDFRNKDPKK